MKDVQKIFLNGVVTLVAVAGGVFGGLKLYEKSLADRLGAVAPTVHEIQKPVRGEVTGMGR